MGTGQSRRCFCKWAMLSGGVLAMGGKPVLAGEDATDADKLKQNMAIKFQTRQARERARLFKKLLAKYGPEILAVVESNTIDSTRERLAASDLSQRDLRGVKAYLWDYIDQGFEVSCTVDTREKLAYRVTKCFLADEMRRHGAADIGYAFYCAYDVGFCQGLNPAIKFTRTKTLMAGDDCCDHTYELEG